MSSNSMSRRGISAIVAVVALTCALTACGPSNGGQGTGSQPRDTGSGGGATATLTEDFVIGTWGDPDDSDDPYLEFAKDGTVTGSDGCNQLAGTWVIEDEAVVFSELATTLMACAGVNTWLSGAASAVIEPDDDDELAFLNAEGVPIGTLERDGPDFDPDSDD